MLSSEARQNDGTGTMATASDRKGRATASMMVNGDDVGKWLYACESTKLFGLLCGKVYLGGGGTDRPLWCRLGWSLGGAGGWETYNALWYRDGWGRGGGAMSCGDCVVWEGVKTEIAHSCGVIWG